MRFWKINLSGEIYYPPKCIAEKHFILPPWDGRICEAETEKEVEDWIKNNLEISYSKQNLGFCSCSFSFTVKEIPIGIDEFLSLAGEEYNSMLKEQP